MKHRKKKKIGEINFWFRFSLSIERSMYSLRNDPQPLNDPQIDLEMVPISPHLDPEMIPN